MLHARSLSGGVAALGLALTLSAAGPAAAANDWGALGTLERAKVQACKVSADGGDAWKIKLRAKNGNDYRVKGSARVYHGETATDRRWGSGWVRGGHTSDVGSVKMGRGGAWQLQFSLGADQFGGGGEVAPADIRRC